LNRRNWRNERMLLIRKQEVRSSGGFVFLLEILNELPFLP